MGAVKALLFDCVEEITEDHDMQDEIFEAVCQGQYGSLRGLIYATEGHLNDTVKEAWRKLLKMCPVEGDRLLASL
jgi:hypothetical protein